jgi:hypothetical protein
MNTEQNKELNREEMEIIMLEYYRARLENDTDKQAEAVKALSQLISTREREAVIAFDEFQWQWTKDNKAVADNNVRDEFLKEYKLSSQSTNGGKQGTELDKGGK